jgi:anti-sigma B factor antagonist
MTASRNEPERRFSCRLVHDHERARVVPLGELDLDTAGVVEQHLDDLRQAGVREIVLDLRDLTFMDSSGLHAIFKADRLAQDDGSSFVLIPGPPAIQRLFELTGTRDHLTFRE